MCTIQIRGIPVSFPCKPYDIQKDYMEKVIECLQNETHGVLESPTGTGKTLSLLCSSLAWLAVQKAKFQAEVRMCGSFFSKTDEDSSNATKLMWDAPTIIYASRTHSQLTQAMQELKRTAYSYVRSTILGSRDQLCIHPDVSQQENNSTKIVMCQAMVKARSCYLQNRVEKMTIERSIQELNIADVEDIVKLGHKHKFCPYYMTRELKKQADVIFLPYNYLLDPKARRAHKLEMKNCVIILDEAHNVEKICEDSSSFQIKTTDMALCIDEITQVMKHIEITGEFNSGDEEKTFSAEDLVLLKSMLLNLEKEIDRIALPKNNEGITYEGKYIFKILESAGINDKSQQHVVSLLDRLIQFMTISKDNPFQRTGTGLQLLQDLLMLVFQNVSEEFKENINRCFKVHLLCEVEKRKGGTRDTWLSKATSKEKTSCRVLSFWCFSPNFAMQSLLEQGIRCIILTSGTLAPLKPLITELGINVGVQLENPHVVTNKQICVKILGTGPDGVLLNSGYQNRNNDKYINSLGMAIINISRQIPNGLLIFYPSYALMNKCMESWQQTEVWENMNDIKRVFIEPKTKDAFNTTMTDFYDRVKDPQYKGATFMAVCRGKVSEGLDFADINGRAVIVIGLPYPPFKDPRVVLKQKYLDICRARDREYLSGKDWYSLEATRAVNQAIGRVIRHRFDYGVIILLDNRFGNPQVKNQLSLWIRGYVQLAKNFGEIIRDTRLFFKNAVEFDKLRDEHQTLFKAVPTVVDINAIKPNAVIDEAGLVNIYKLNKPEINPNKPGCSGANLLSDKQPAEKIDIQNVDNVTSKFPVQERKKIKLQPPDFNNTNASTSLRETKKFISKLKETLSKPDFETFIQGVTAYQRSSDLQVFVNYLNLIFKPNKHLRFLIQGMITYVKDQHQTKFIEYWESMRCVTMAADT